MSALVINLLGAPGAGKSTTRAGVFHKLKLKGYNVEEVIETAKAFTYEERTMAIGCQPYVFGKQLMSMERVAGKVDIIVTDSPLVLSAYYGETLQPGKYPESFYDSIFDIASGRFINKYYYIKRVKKYNPIGRNQTEEESDRIGHDLITYLYKNMDIGSFKVFDGDETAVDKIVEDIEQEFSQNRND